MRTIILTILVINSLVTAGWAANNSYSFYAVVPTPSLNVTGVKYSDNDAAVEGTSCVPGTTVVNDGNFWLCDTGGVYTKPITVWEQAGTKVYLKDTNATNFVGIGTSDPEFKLTLDQDGGILAKGSVGSGVTPTTAGAGTRLMWIPSKSALRAGTVGATQWDNANIGNYSVAFGLNNEAFGVATNINGGSGNTADQNYSTIGGGSNNNITDWPAFPYYTNSVIAGGNTNTIDQSGNAFIGGGYSNSIGNAAEYSVIGGGNNNTIPVNISYASIVGGTNNLANDAGGFIGGGLNNSVAGGLTGFNVVVGGVDNDIGGGTSTHGFIGGGTTNKISGQYSVIGGGSNNTIPPVGYLGMGHTIAGGINNKAGGNLLFEGHATVSGGHTNSALGDYSAVGGGKTNTASGYASAVPGGQDNIAAGDHSVAMGQNAQISAAGDNTFAYVSSGAPVSITQPNSAVFYGVNVGIGITAPTQSLHISQAMRLEPMDSPPSCEEGVMYAHTSGALCYCSAGSWTDLTDGKTGGFCP